MLATMGDMQHAAVLDIGSGPNLDMVDIPTQHTHGPDGDIIAKDDIAYHHSGFVN